MCTRGVWQLQTLILRYCPHGGSSRGMREYIRNGAKQFARDNKQIQIKVETKPGKHPLCVGQYLNENEKVIDVKNENATDIASTAQFLRDQSGRTVHSVRKNQIRATESIQGVWKPDMEWPKFTVTHH